MDKCVKIGSVKCSLDSDIYDFHIDAWFRQTCLDAVNWCDEHYPGQVKFLRKEDSNLEQFYKYIEWYAEFQTNEAYTHFILCTDVNKEEYV